MDKKDWIIFILLAIVIFCIFNKSKETVEIHHEPSNNYYVIAKDSIINEYEIKKDSISNEVDSTSIDTVYNDLKDWLRARIDGTYIHP